MPHNINWTTKAWSSICINANELNLAASLLTNPSASSDIVALFPSHLTSSHPVKLPSPYGSTAPR